MIFLAPLVVLLVFGFFMLNLILCMKRTRGIERHAQQLQELLDQSIANTASAMNTIEVQKQTISSLFETIDKYKAMLPEAQAMALN